MKTIIILGTGGNCIDILDAINEINICAQTEIYRCVGFLDDNLDSHGKDYFGVKVLGPLTSAGDYPDCTFVNGIGSDANFWSKHEIIARTGQPLDAFENVIHPTASVSQMSRLGRGVVVMQNATIASNARVGNHVIVLPNSVISHDCTVGDYTCIAGGVCISGGVRIGKSCYLGTNSSIKGNVDIADNCLVGMGSVVLKDVPENSVVAGNPAAFLRKTISG
jgi:sugar O-acyltransferase (sialic acid O-acetyltransferase NeuD family)